MNVLLIGDVVGRSGRSAVRARLPHVVSEFDVDVVIANGENAAGGFGITESVAEEMFALGVHIITSGNHVWDKKEAEEYLDREPRVLRPLNYPPGTPGFGSAVHKLPGGVQLAVLNLSGRVFMPPLDCPFRAAETEVERLSSLASSIVVDFHAEATSEKIAMGRYLDGRVSAVIGTHTHVQTADEQVLPGGTAYITDVGMTGPADSIIGMKQRSVLERFLRQMPTRFETATGPSLFAAAMVSIDENSGRATGMRRLLLKQA